MVAGVTRKRMIWNLPKSFPLNQGQEGACVGFGWSAELACDPVQIPASNSSAFKLYEAARAQDQLMGNDFGDGASVLAGVKACQQLGWVSSYRWAMGIDDVVDTLCARGPVVLGINWYDGMYETEEAGRVRLNGQLVGGHCILATGYIPEHPVWGGNWVQWTNSWGKTYGVNGRGYISVDDLSRLLQENGEAVVAMDVMPKPKVPWWQRLLDYC
jgi:hypothetical protein